MEEAPDHSMDPIRKFTVRDFFNFSQDVAIEEIDFINEAVEMNKKLAMAGLNPHTGGGFGMAFKSLEGDSIVTKAKALTAAASDARMAGVDLPAMSCASSGNVGIAASLPLAALAEELEKDKEELLRAVALSFLTTIYLKSHIGRLSALCACAIAASLGVTAGAVRLLGGKHGQVEMAIQNVVGGICGIICDGAKLGCALKLAMAAGVALESAHFAIKGVAIPARDGLVFDTADETIAAVGRVAVNGMMKTDEVVCRLIIDREKG
jgi:L-cysteine desulfidase